MRRLFLLRLLPVMLLNGCSLFSGEEGVVKMSLLPTVTGQFTPFILWSASVGNGVGNFYSNLHPAFSSGLVYAADRKGIVCAFNVKNGKKVWAVSLEEKGGWFSHAPALLSGGITASGAHIYVGSEKAKVYALNANDGSILWQTPVAGEALSSPVVRDGMVLIHTSNGQLQALSEENGELKWSVTLDIPFLSLRGESSPAIALGAAIVGNDNGCVSAVLIQQGQMIWKKRISQSLGATEIDRLNDVDITPVVVHGVVYALAYNGNLIALDLQTGKIIWKRELGSVNNFVVNRNRIYLIDQDDRLLALSSEDGVTLWTQSNLLHRLLAVPALYNDNLVVGDSKGYMYWIDLETGHLVSEQKVDSSGFQTEMVVAEGKIFIQAKNGTLYAIMR